MRRILVAAVVTALSITGIIASPAVAADANTWHVQAGSVAFGATGPVGGGNRFYPEAIAIHAGDSVAFTPMAVHTVTFNRPPVPVFALFGPFGGTLINSPAQSTNSGIIGDTGPVPYTVTFASTLPTGTYSFICGLHIGMTETITVLPPSQALPRTDAEYGLIAQREVTRDLATLADIAAEANQDNEDEDGDGGPTVWAGAGNKRGSNLRFFPSVITVHVGQAITFVKTHDPTEPHTVTFGQENPDPILQLIPSGGNTYDGTGTVNSGFLSTKAQFGYYQLAGTPLVQATKLKVNFTRAGTFDYVCELHDVVGMVGRVIVRP